MCLDLNILRVGQLNMIKESDSIPVGEQKLPDLPFSFRRSVQSDCVKERWLKAQLVDFCTGQSLGVLTGEQLLFRKTGNKDVLKKEINLI